MDVKHPTYEMKQCVNVKHPTNEMKQCVDVKHPTNEMKQVIDYSQFACSERTEQGFLTTSISLPTMSGLNQ